LIVAALETKQNRQACEQPTEMFKDLLERLLYLKLLGAMTGGERQKSNGSRLGG